MDLESALLVFFVAVFSVILRDTVDVGLLGFTLVYTVALSGMFQWTVRQSAEVTYCLLHVCNDSLLFVD